MTACRFPAYSPIYGYRLGCRCARCLGGVRDYQRGWRLRRYGPPRPTSTPLVCTCADPVPHVGRWAADECGRCRRRIVGA